MKMWPFLYSLQFETGVIRAGVNGAGVKKGPALKGPIRYIKKFGKSQLADNRCEKKKIEYHGAFRITFIPQT